MADFLIAAPLVLLVALPGALTAQAIVTVSPQQCVWHVGDNPAWAAPNLDDSAWQPYSTWKLNPSQSSIWVRCHTEPSLPNEFDKPAIQVRLLAAYQVFMNGALIGSNGGLDSGLFTMNSIQIFPVPPSIAANPNVLSLRIVFRFASPDTGGIVPGPEIRLGDVQGLRDNRAGVLVSQLQNSLSTNIPFIGIGIMGLVLLGFAVPDRTHPEPVLLALTSIFIGLMFVNFIFETIMIDEPVWAFLALYSLTSTANMLAQVAFYFGLAHKRIPVIFRLLMGVWILRSGWELAELLLPPHWSLRLDTIHYFVADPASLVALAILLGFGPFVAFWPYKGIPRRMRAVAALSAAWGAILIAFFLVLVADYVPGLADLLQAFQSALFPVQTIVQACVVVALIALVVREQRQVAVERSALAGEMEAAQRMQRALIPESIDSLSRFKIEIAFHPAREVGGDFYSCRILGAGRQRILLGDVSGKGAAAAMTAAVLLGAAERRENDSPVELLCHLNLVMSDMRLGGFATCVCADLSADGSLNVANAGHLAPYRNGEEVPMPPGLPLGITADTGYDEIALTLNAGDTLTLFTDGVVEARNTRGELFGFERTREISRQSAESIAQAAQAFGQEDDITVLILKLL